MKRNIILIDDEKCNGCGQCVPSCAEGALMIVNGKARLITDKLCDGLGACLGDCPQGALTIVEREADAFDEEAVHAHLAQNTPPPPAEKPYECGCPGTHARVLAGKKEVSAPLVGGSAPSELGQWPVQLKLLNPAAASLKNADLLICADCVPFAYADFHQHLLRGRAVAVGCPKLDDGMAYVEKLAQIISLNDLKSITVARMEVPCCGGLLNIVREAIKRSGCNVAVETVKISLDGTILETQKLSV